MLSVKSPVMNKAVTVLKNLNADERERLIAWDHERDEMMMKSEIKYAKEEGKAEGENKKALETAKNMLKDNIKKENISKFTGLSVPEIDSID